MSDDRRYKQRGYQEGDQRPSRPTQGLSPEGRRIPVITAYKETVRCAECGLDLSTAFQIEMESRCPKCSADLHTCRNCRHFDTASRFECSQQIKQRIGKKSAANRCTLFTARTIVVKELGQASALPNAATAPRASSSRPVDEARAALERLFKK
jgi:phage FluMu protein Com